MNKRTRNKSWFSSFLAILIFLITISFTIDKNYKTHFEGTLDCFSSIDTDSVCNLVPLNYRVYPLGLNLKNKDSISRTELLKADKLECEDKRFEIISFVVGAGDGGCVGGYGLFQQAYCFKNGFSENAKCLIKISLKGGPIFFDCIAAKTKAGKIFLLKPVIYRLKDSPYENCDPIY